MEKAKPELTRVQLTADYLSRVIYNEDTGESFAFDAAYAQIADLAQYLFNQGLTQMRRLRFYGRMPVEIWVFTKE